ncbi:hypothetical protein K8U54_17760 [Pseudomonas fulva]|uniref:hypothetical protein n=1 Tax=Pseudomonas fulva TaxID=47880 RepID=UPI00201DA22A|nr:hypothetical protein [Pseudomonas fulva]UQY33550.1 hypothetical protein K8U54_17760 [Pseudomonas fulva]
MSAIKERPILFSGPMVRAILDGRKTVKRRAMKVQPHDGASVTVERFNTTVTDRQGNQDAGPEVFGAWWSDGECSLTCPYGQPGDRLWVRETWSVEMLAGYSEEGGYSSEYELRYRADDSEREISVAAGEPDPWINLYDSQRGEWRPSIHMPRAACRILLEVTDVRVERLQDITGDQAEAEGGDSAMCRQFLETSPSRHECKEAVIHGFAGLWASINGDDSWHANPWVWLVEFKRIEQ